MYHTCLGLESCDLDDVENQNNTFDVTFSPQVPELYRLYNSAHVTDSRKHRSFLLSILSSGIRQIIDYKISQRSFTSTLMMGMLQAPTVDAELKVNMSSE